MPFLLAVSGKKQSGKDTLVNFLTPIFESAGSVEYFTFADQLKKFLIEGMGLERNQVWGSDFDKNQLTNFIWEKLPYEIRRVNTIHGEQIRSGKMSARELMQVFGTDIMRQMFDDKIWVNACFRSIYSINPDFALLPDLRFPSELNPWIEKNGFVIRLMRDVSNGDSHSSETSLDDWPWHEYKNVLVIPSNSTIKECRDTALEWLTPRVTNYILHNCEDSGKRISNFNNRIQTVLKDYLNG